MKNPAIIFQKDEQRLGVVQPHWNESILLSQEGIFYLKDICPILKLDPLKVKRRFRELQSTGNDPWRAMGARKVWNHWMVRMTVFGPYYQKHLVSKIQKISASWDGNLLLTKKGIFKLVDACRLLPFSTYQLRYQAKQNPKAKEEFGVWKDPETNQFVVDMERFAVWIKSLWRQPYRGGK